MMLLNDAYKAWKENPSGETYDQLGEALLRYTRLEVNRNFRTKATAEEREDIAGNGLIRIFERLDQFKGNSAFNTWVSAVLINEGKEMQRRGAKNPEQGYVGDEMHDPGPSMNDKITLRQLLSKLPAGDREFVQLHLEGYSRSEIAPLVGTSVDAAKKRWERIQTRLRTQYGGKLGEVIEG